jgi:hypothetical protein
MGNPTFRGRTNAVDGVALRVGIHPVAAGRGVSPSVIAREAIAAYVRELGPEIA